MLDYKDIETNEKVDAVIWNGDTLVFQDWEYNYGKLPFNFTNFPELKIQNTNSHLHNLYYVKLGDWVVRTRNNVFLGFRDSVFKQRYKEV